jgi:hypothetical protein
LAIDVKKTQTEKKKGKSHEEALDIHNEIKIITSQDETFELWIKVISSHSQGELFDPETNPLKKFKGNKSWRPEKDGVLNREFFKWLGNLSKSDHRAFARHILNCPNVKRPYMPKVTMKTISSVLISYYNAKEWIESRKRKQLVRREFNRMNPRLQLFKANGEFWPEKWKLFKKNYNITSAMMQVLLEAPGEEFFSSAKQTRNKNKTVGQLFPYAKEFFRIFLKRKLEFRKPVGRAFFPA